MPFPDAPRVFYRKNPLEQVICQLRFPPVLRIDTELPAKFQEHLRGDFPNFAETPDARIEITRGVGDQIPPEIARQILQSITTKNYAFSTSDGSYVVNLARSFLSLTTTSYERWEVFKDRLALPLQALHENYSPPYFSRVGLRYVNVIVRSKVGLPGVAWRDLLSSSLIGLLGSPETAESVQAFESVHEIRLTERGGGARIAAKLVRRGDSQEVAFMLDSDFFDTSRTDSDRATERLDFFNLRASRLIRWSIKEPLHAAMDPELI